MGKKEVVYKARLENAKAMDYLKKILDSLDSGTCYLQSDDSVVALEPAELVDLEVEALEKRDKKRLTIELSWYAPSPSSEVPDLRITTEAPEVVPAPEPEEVE